MQWHEEHWSSWKWYKSCGGKSQHLGEADCMETFYNRWFQTIQILEIHTICVCCQWIIVWHFQQNFVLFCDTIASFYVFSFPLWLPLNITRVSSPALETNSIFSKQCHTWTFSQDVNNEWHNWHNLTFCQRVGLRDNKKS